MTLFKRPSSAVAAAIALLAAAIAPIAAQAQITLDSTLGSESSTVTEGAIIRGDLADLIEGGATRSGNLFHSFLEFNVDEAQRVYFASPDGIESILSRITGSDPSNIFGTLGVDGSADLFLLNPNGIVFGENAALDIKGSFYGTTGDAIALGDEIFSAVEPEQSRLLTVNPSVQFENYLTAASSDIENRGQLAATGDLTLAANKLDLQGQVAAGGDLTLLALDDVQIRDAVETPFIGFAGGDLLVQGNQQVNIVALSHPDSGLYTYGDMVLRSANPVSGDAHYWSGGSFRVETLNGEAGNLYSPIDPIIRSLGDVVIDQYEGSSLHILAGGSVNIGTAEINAPDVGELDINFLQETVTLSDGTVVEVDGGKQPTLDIRAGIAPDALGMPPLESLTGFDPATDAFFGNAFITDLPLNADIVIGDVFIAASDGLVLLTNQNQPNTDIEGSIFVTGGGIYGDGIDARGSGSLGSLVILDSRNNIAINDFVAINSCFSTSCLEDGKGGDIGLIADSEVSLGSFSSLLTNGGGNIAIQGNRFLMQKFSQISSPTGGLGNGGNITLRVPEEILIDGGNIGTFNNSFQASSTGGDIIIETGRLTAIGAAVFLGAPLPNGFLTGGDITSDTIGSGDAGNISITAEEMQLRNGAQIRASTIGDNGTEGNAGDITIRATDILKVTGFTPESGDPSKIATSVNPRSVGEGGELRIETNRLIIEDGAQIQAGIFGQGQGGSIFINAEETVEVLDYREDDRPTGIFSGPEGAMATGNSGDITLTADTVALSGPEATISNEVDGEASGNAGKVEIDSRILTVRDGSRIAGRTFGRGRGGTLVINGTELIEVAGTDGKGSSSSLSTETLGLADAGNLVVNAGDLLILNGGQVASSSLGVEEGVGGELTINATGTVKVSGFSSEDRLVSTISASSGSSSNLIFPGSVGNGGSLSINAENLIISDSASVSTESFGRGLNPNFPGQAGNAGNLSVNVSGRLDVSNDSGLEASTYGNGDAGNLTIRAGELFVRNNSEISSSTNGNLEDNFTAEGSAGNIEVTVAGLTELSGVGGLGTGSTFGGDAGNVNLTTGSLVVQNGAGIRASAFGRGKTGGIRIQSTDSIVVTGGRFVSSSDINEAVGDNFYENDEKIFLPSTITIQSSTLPENLPGSLVIDTAQLQVLNGGSIIATTNGANGGGNIDITALYVEVNGTSASADPSEITSRTGGSGNAGSIFIEAPFLTINNGAEVVASSTRPNRDSTIEIKIGDAGNISLRIPEQLLLQNGTVATDAESSNGGQIQIDGGTILLFGNSDIQTFVNSGEDDGGDITIAADAIVALDDSDILAFAADGRGGNIDLSQTTFFGEDFTFVPSGTDPRTLEGNDRVDINATGGIASGQISINDASFIENSLGELSGEIIDPSTLIAGSCIARADSSIGAFVVTGRNGLPQGPEGDILPAYPTNTIQTVSEGSELISTSTIQEPQGAYQLADGRLVLSYECE